MAPAPAGVLLFQADDLPFFFSEQPAAPPGLEPRTSGLMPNVERLREEGVVFTKAYASSPMCVPSRAGVLTGRYGSRNIYSESQGLGGAENFDCCVPFVTGRSVALDARTIGQNATLPHLLRAAGWRTGHCGKWHLSGNFWPLHYQTGVDAIHAAGFDVAAGVYWSNFPDVAPYRPPTVGSDEQYFHWRTAEERFFSHNEEWVAAHALEFINSSHATGRRWFLSLNPTAPHTDRPSIQEAMLNWSIKATPAGLLSKAPSSGSMRARAEVWANASARKAASGLPDEKWELAAAMWVDDSLGAMLDLLEELGALDTTAVFFAMDHGEGAKRSLYEHGLRIALRARYPPVWAAGTTWTQPVSNLDLTPTILALAALADDYDADASAVPLGCDAPARRPPALDGMSLLEPEAAHQGRALIFEHNDDRAVLVGELKLLLYDTSLRCRSSACAELYEHPTPTSKQYPGEHPDRGESAQLYNLTSDPAEQRSLSGLPSFAALHDELGAIISAHLAATDPRLQVPDLWRSCYPAAPPVPPPPSLPSLPPPLLPPSLPSVPQPLALLIAVVVVGLGMLVGAGWLIRRKLTLRARSREKAPTHVYV